MRIDAESLYNDLSDDLDALKLKGEVFLSRSGLVDLNATVCIDRQGYLEILEEGEKRRSQRFL
jgi:hypothetical protein